MTASQEPTTPTFLEEARSLIRRASSAYDEEYGLSTTSCQVYDTAWVAMVTKANNGTRRWLFEGSFFYLLRTQSNDGSWGRNTLSQTVCVLDTASALLALVKHSKEPLQILGPSELELQERIQRATRALESQLMSWHDVSSTNHIGVEMIVPALLRYLEQEGIRIPVHYPAKELLAKLNALKMARFDPEKLYGPTPSSALHSLEAFIGDISFDRVTHHLFQGSMLASPSSTAAYLIEASLWDDRAEDYLQHVFARGSGHGDGGIPGTFPTTYFEYSWVSCPQESLAR